MNNCCSTTVFPRMLFALKLYSPSYSVRTTVWPECLLLRPRIVFPMCSKRCARAIVIRKDNLLSGKVSFKRKVPLYG